MTILETKVELLTTLRAERARWEALFAQVHDAEMVKPNWRATLS